MTWSEIGFWFVVTLICGALGLSVWIHEHSGPNISSDQNNDDPQG